MKKALWIAPVAGAAILLSFIPQSVNPPNTLKFNKVSKTWTNVTLSWDGGPATVEFAYDINWTWGAITNAESPVTVPATMTNMFYRLVQSKPTLNRWAITTNDAVYWDKRPFVGDNKIAFMAHGDVVSCLTNGAVNQVVLVGAIPAPEYCSTDCIAYDPSSQKLYTFYNQCYYGQGGPFTFVEYQMVGADGHFSTAYRLSEERDAFGEYGDTMGDMLLTDAGGIVVCWKSPHHNYGFQYRTSDGVWQEPFYETTIEQRVSHIRLGQHPDGGIFWFVSRDGIHDPVPTIRLHETNDNLVIDWIKPTFSQEGEFPVVTSIRDNQSGTLKVARSTDPYHGFIWKEGFGFRKGSAFGVVDLSGDGTTNDSEMYPSQYGNYSEPVGTHAAVLVNGVVWVVRQEWNYLTLSFDLVYATPYNGTWGDRVFFYQAKQGGNFRGGAHNKLTSYYNCDANPSWALFGNTDEQGVFCLFQINP